MFRRAGSFEEAEVGSRPHASVFRQSVVANVLNPKVAIFFISFFPQYVQAEAGSVFVQTTLLGAAFIAVTFLVFGTVGLLAAQLHAAFAKNPQRKVLLERIGGVMLVLIACYLGWPSQ